MTLTELSFYVRKFLPFGIIGILMMFIFFYVFQLLLIVGPTKTNTQISFNTVFQKIKEPDIADATPSGKFKYVLDTIDGQPVVASSAGSVYYLPPSTTRFGYRDKAVLMAKTLGIDTDAARYSLKNETTAQFLTDQQSFTVDITNFNFTYQYDPPASDPIFTDLQVPSPEAATANASDFLKSMDRYPEELAQGKTNIVYLHIEPGTKNLSVVQKPADANMIEVDFYRPDIDEYPIVAPKYFNSPNYVVLLYNAKDFKILRAQVKFFEKSTEQVGIYPLRSGDEAWKQLQDGKGKIVVSPGTVPNNTIKIKQMFLGYYDPDIYQDYLEPVFVFLGEGNFAAYVPAVSKDWLTE